MKAIKNICMGVMCEAGSKTQLCPRKVIGSIGMIVALVGYFMPYINDQTTNTLIISCSALLAATTADKFVPDKQERMEK